MVVEARDATKHPTVHRTAPPQRRIIWPKTIVNSAEVEKPPLLTVELTIWLKELKSSLNCFSDQETLQKDFDVMHERTLIFWLGSPFQLASLTRKVTYLVRRPVCTGALWAHTTLRTPRKYNTFTPWTYKKVSSWCKDKSYSTGIDRTASIYHQRHLKNGGLKMTIKFGCCIVRYGDRRWWWWSAM